MAAAVRWDPKVIATYQKISSWNQYTSGSMKDTSGCRMLLDYHFAKQTDSAHLRGKTWFPWSLHISEYKAFPSSGFKLSACRDMLYIGLSVEDPSAGNSGGRSRVRVVSLVSRHCLLGHTLATTKWEQQSLEQTQPATAASGCWDNWQWVAKLSLIMMAF